MSLHVSQCTCTMRLSHCALIWVQNWTNQTSCTPTPALKQWFLYAYWPKCCRCRQCDSAALLSVQGSQQMTPSLRPRECFRPLPLVRLLHCGLEASWLTRGKTLLISALLRETFRHKREEGTWDSRKLHNEEFHNLYCSPDIVRAIKMDEMGEACSTYTGGEKCIRAFWWVIRVTTTLGTPSKIWKNNIKIERKQTGC